jgi:hypothetical protein
VRATGLRTFVPVEAQPTQSIEDDLHRLLGVAGLVGVFNPEDKLASVMARKEPVEEGGASASNV